MEWFSSVISNKMEPSELVVKFIIYSRGSEHQHTLHIFMTCVHHVSSIHWTSLLWHLIICRLHCNAAIGYYLNLCWTKTFETVLHTIVICENEQLGSLSYIYAGKVQTNLEHRFHCLCQPKYQTLTGKRANWDLQVSKGSCMNWVKSKDNVKPKFQFVRIFFCWNIIEIIITCDFWQWLFSNLCTEAHTTVLQEEEEPCMSHITALAISPLWILARLTSE